MYRMEKERSVSGRIPVCLLSRSSKAKRCNNFFEFLNAEYLHVKGKVTDSVCYHVNVDLYVKPS